MAQAGTEAKRGLLELLSHVENTGIYGMEVSGQMSWCCQALEAKLHWEPSVLITVACRQHSSSGS